RGFDPVCVLSGAEALELLSAQDFDVVVTDVNMRGITGIELCQRAVANRPDVPVIVITAFGSMDTAIAAMRAGAYDFIPKPVDMDALEFALVRGIGHHRLRTEVKRLREVVAATQRCGDMIGTSTVMRKVYDLID